MTGLTFPSSPQDGETIFFTFTHTGGDANNSTMTKSWSWNASRSAWVSNNGQISSEDYLTQSDLENYVKKTGDTMTGTLTGTSSSFTSLLTASNGFIGTLTGTNASFDTIEGSTGVFSFLGIGSNIFSAQDIIDPDAEPIIFGVTGGRNSYFDTNVTIGASGSTSKGWLWVRGGLDESVNSFQVEGNSVFRDDVEIGKDSFYALNFGSTAYQGTQNPNVPVINSQGGVLIGGNTYTKQNWLGNNVYLAPEGYVTVGIPNNVPSGWFEGKRFTDPGGTYPFDLRALNVSGGIYTNGILEVSPALATDPENWVFVAGSVTGDSGQYANALTAANNFAISSISNPEHKGAVFSIGDLYVGRTNIRENAQLKVHGRALKEAGPADFQSNEYVTKSYVDNNVLIYGSAGGYFAGGHRTWKNHGAGDNISITINPISDIGYPGPYIVSVTAFPRNSNGWSYNTPSFHRTINCLPGTANFTFRSTYGGSSSILVINNTTRTLDVYVPNGAGYGYLYIMTITPYRS